MELGLPWGEAREIAAGSEIGGGPSAGWGRGCDGPFWIHDRGHLAFSDTGNHRRLVWSESAGLRAIIGDTNRAVGATVDEQGRVVSCEWATGRVVRQEHDGSVAVIAATYGGLRLNRPDDVVVTGAGVVFFTDVRDPFTDRRQPFAVPAAGSVPRSGVYRVAPGSDEVELVSDRFDEPGGLALSPAGDVLYVSDPRAGEVAAFQVSADDCIAGEATTVASIGDGGDGPYGLSVDQKGHIYCGGPGVIWVIEHGARVATIPIPSSKVTNLAFGGDDWSTLFFTTPVGVGAIETRTEGVPLPSARIDVDSETGAVTISRRVVRNDSRVERLVAPGTRIEVLASGGVLDDLGGGPSHRFARSLEGPVWVPDRDCLVFSDIGNDRQLCWSEADGLSLHLRPTGHANGATLDTRGRILRCEHSGRRVTREEQDGSVTVVADRYDGRQLSRPNDVVVRSDGCIYFTAPWWDFGADEEQEIDFDGVFLVSPDHASVTALVTDFVLPNGLCFSPDEKVLYVDDTRRRHIRAFDVLADGSLDLATDRVLIELTGDGPGSPDGMAVDVDGNLYCGGPGGIWIVSPDGAHLGTIEHGAAQTNNLAFGGPDLKTLFFVSWVTLGCVRTLVPGAPVPRNGSG